MAQYIQKGDAIHYQNGSGAAIAYGAVVPLPTRVGIAAADIPAGETGVLNLTGVYAMEAAAEAIGFGDAVYWDADEQAVTKTEAGNTPVGISLTDKTTVAAGGIAVRLG